MLLLTDNYCPVRRRKPVLLETDIHAVVGCPFTVGVVYMPCVTVQWEAAATSLSVNGAGVLVETSIGQCLNAAGAPQGVAIVSGAGSGTGGGMSTAGQHLAFPFRIGNDGRAVTADTLADQVLQELQQLVLTNPGERLFLPDFGGGATRLLFETTDANTTSLAQATLTQAIQNWLAGRVNCRT